MCPMKEGKRGACPGSTRLLGAVVATGGMFGAWLRYSVSLFVPFHAATGFPLATLFINVGGAFFMGWFTAFVRQRQSLSPYWKVFISTGMTGAFTTYSTFALETIQLVEHNRVGTAIAYQLFSLMLGIGAAAVGYRIGMKHTRWGNWT